MPVPVDVSDRSLTLRVPIGVIGTPSTRCRPSGPTRWPYGGVKESGNTREGSSWAVREMTEERRLVVAL